MSVEEEAAALVISRALAYEAVQHGDIPRIRIGRRILVPRSRLRKMLDSTPANEKPRPATAALGHNAPSPCTSNRFAAYRCRSGRPARRRNTRSSGCSRQRDTYSTDARCRRVDRSRNHCRHRSPVRIRQRIRPRLPCRGDLRTHVSVRSVERQEEVRAGPLRSVTSLGSSTAWRRSLRVVTSRNLPTRSPDTSTRPLPENSGGAP